MIEVHQFPCLSDNYGFLLHDPASGETVCIDTPDAEEYLRQAAAKNWRITQIWNTHWHPDHIGGNEAIKAATGCRVIAPAVERDRIASADRVVGQGDSVALGEWVAEVLDVGGHTLGHVAYHLRAAGVAFVGDAVFALGCGRMFEGTPAQFWASLERIKALPDETLLFCAHEYTESNLRFALHVEPSNADLHAYAAEIRTARARNLPTVPAQLGREKRANPFLRADHPDVAGRWGGGGSVETFAALRQAKDNF